MRSGSFGEERCLLVHGVSRPLKFIKQPLKLLGCHFYLAEDIPHERTSYISAFMMGHRCGAPIGMPVENMAPFLADRLEPHLEQGLLDLQCVKSWEPRQRFTAIF